MSDLALKVLLTASDQASGTVKGFLNTLTGFAGDTGPLIAGLVGIGAAAIGIGAYSTKAAADFQESMNRVKALAAPATENINQMSNAVLDMSVKVGQAPTKLADGLYFIESAGIHGKQALDLLRLSAEAASSGGVKDLKTVADAATSAINSFGQKNLDSQRAVDVMTATVSAGKTTWDAYARSVSRLSSGAAQGKVSFEEANSALALFTRTGESSQLAAGHLSSLFLYLGTQTDKMSQNAKKLKIDFDAQKFSSLDLAGKIDYLNKATGGNFAEVQKLLGGNKTLATTYEKLKDNSGTYKTILDGLNHSHGATDQAFATTSAGFNASMQRVQAAINVVLIKIGTALLPILTTLADKAAPALLSLVNNGEKVIAFFRNNQTAMDALKAGLIGFGVFVLALVVPAFIAWAIAAAGAAVATLAATWPFILIGIVVALVVFGIIQVVRNWGAITAWLSAQWGRFSGWFMGILHSVGAFFVGVWNGMKAGLQAAWNAIVNVVRVALAVLVMIFLGPFIAIGALFIWLYNHNYYFKALIDGIVNFVKGGLAWLQQAWSASVAFLVGLWQAVSKYASQLWGMITAAIQVEIDTAWQFLVSIWTTASSWLSDRWNQFSTFARNAWQAVSNVFSGIWNTYIAGPLNSLSSSISGFFTGLANTAVQWGQNLIQGIINGINNMAGQAGQAAQNIAKNIASFLGFHSPSEKGPGSELNVWGPNLVKGFSQGMLDTLPTLDHAVNVTASRLTPLATPASAGGGASARGGNGMVVINITINAPARTRNEAQDIANQVKQILSKELRGSANLNTWTSGGKY